MLVGIVQSGGNYPLYLMTDRVYVFLTNSPCNWNLLLLCGYYFCISFVCNLLPFPFSTQILTTLVSTYVYALFECVSCNYVSKLFVLLCLIGLLCLWACKLNIPDLQKPRITWSGWLGEAVFRIIFDLVVAYEANVVRLPWLLNEMMGVKFRAFIE